MIIFHNQNQYKTWNYGTNGWVVNISPRTLQATQRCTTGIPKIPNTSSLFKCPFCEKAKMIKRSGQRKQQDACIPGQVFHMDLSYVSGPSNLDDILSHNTPPEPTIKRS